LLDQRGIGTLSFGNVLWIQIVEALRGGRSERKRRRGK
jgi:hypothetical protein